LFIESATARIKVFWFFFSKKNFFLVLSLPQNDTQGDVMD
jgi:hypothetical protein